MPAERYYYPSSLAESEEISLQDQEFHHLTRVMRGKIGDTIELVNGQGALAKAKIRTIEKRQAVLHIKSCHQDPPPSYSFILAQAIPKINRLDFIVEKGTELGMTHLWLFPGELSERKIISENQHHRLHSIAISAMKQCGSLWLPQIEIKSPIHEWKSVDCPAFFGDVNPNAEPLIKVLSRRDAAKKMIFFIGPESGFTDREEKKLREIGALGVKLHPNILRTDTAPIVALGILTHLNLFK